MQDYINNLIQIFQSIYFQKRLLIHRLLGLPAQTNKEIRIIKKIFETITDGKQIKVFEWGSGLSTIYYTQFLIKRDIDFEWHSIDNNKMWYEIVRAKIEKKNLRHCIKLYLKEFPSFLEKPGWGPIPPPCGIFGPNSENEKDYINFPKILNEKFDIIIIDARFRRHCLQTAKGVLVPSGVVILHDAQKQHYHIGLEDFKYKKFIPTGSWYFFQKIPNKIWVGSNRNLDLLNKI